MNQAFEKWARQQTMSDAEKKPPLSRFLQPVGAQVLKKAGGCLGKPKYF